MKIQLSEHFTYRKLLRFTLPSVAMMVVSSLYSVVDGLFVSNFVGKTSFAAVNLIMPFLGVFSAFGMMIAAGGTALVSKTLGMGDRKRANELFSMLLSFCTIGGAILTVLSIVMMRPVAIALGGEGQVLEDAVIYGIIVQLALIGYYFEFSFQSFGVAAEKPGLPLIMSAVSGVGNILLETCLAGGTCCSKAGDSGHSLRTATQTAFLTAAHHVCGEGTQAGGDIQRAGTLGAVYLMR